MLGMSLSLLLEQLDLLIIFFLLIGLMISFLAGALQLTRLFATPTWHLFMISTRSLSARCLSILILSNHPLQKRISRSSSGENL